MHPAFHTVPSDSVNYVGFVVFSVANRETEIQHDEWTFPSANEQQMRNRDALGLRPLPLIKTDFFRLDMHFGGEEI